MKTIQCIVITVQTIGSSVVIVQDLRSIVVIIKSIGTVVIFVKTLLCIVIIIKPSINTCTIKTIDIIVVLALMPGVIVKPVAREPRQSDRGGGTF